MRSRAPARAVDDGEYSALRARLIPGPCQTCAPLLDALLELDPGRGSPVRLDCRLHTGWELHHRRKRSASGALGNPANVVVTCHAGNMAIEDWPEAAHLARLVVREGDPEWIELSARAWRLAR